MASSTIKKLITKSFGPPENDVFDQHYKRLLEYIGHIHNGFYIECGANDGVFFSYTYKLERDLNWKGILIEPSKKSFKKSKIFRSRENTFYNCALVSDRYSGKYINGDFDGNYKSSVSGNKLKNDVNISVRARTLNSIIEETQPEKINLFSLDVEGYELEVLEGLNLSKYRPEHVLIEVGDGIKRRVFEYLTANKYSYIADITNFNLKNNPSWDQYHNDYLFSDNTIHTNKGYVIK